MTKGLTLEEMGTVSRVFQESINFVLEGIPQADQKNIHELFLELILQTPVPSLLVTTSGVADLQKKIFKNEVLRDYIMKLSFVFFSRCAPSDEFVICLARNLARGLAQTPFDPSVKDHVAMPEQQAARVLARDDVYNRLVSNPWLMVVMLVPLFMSKKIYETNS